jgi:hypothetical protein
MPIESGRRDGQAVHPMQLLLKVRLAPFGMQAEQQPPRWILSEAEQVVVPQLVGDPFNGLASSVKLDREDASESLAIEDTKAIRSSVRRLGVHAPAGRCFTLGESKRVIR